MKNLEYIAIAVLFLFSVCQKNVENRLSFYSLPLIAGYEKDLGCFTLNTGVGLNLHFGERFTGIVLHVNGHSRIYA